VLPLKQVLRSALLASVALIYAEATSGQISPPTVQFPSGTTNPAPPPVPSATPAPPPVGAPKLPAAPAVTAPPKLQAPPTSPNFDPYADPTLPSQPFNPSAPPLGTSPPGTAQQPLFNEATFGQWPRFLQQLRFRQMYMNRGGQGGLGWTETAMSGTFLMPLSFMPENAPLLVTPGFNFNWLNGPNSQVAGPGAQAPPRLYAGYLDLGWSPQLTHGLSADVGFRAGIYSDFKSITWQSWRWQGRGFGVWQTNDKFQWRAGLIYLDRLTIKLLPAGGLVYTPGGPDGKMKFDILFPNPKFSYRLDSFRNADLRWYLAGEYGGGTWSQKFPNLGTIQPQPPANTTGRIEYNDIRLISGIEWAGYYGLKGFAESAYVFNRQLRYDPNYVLYDPSSTWMIRGGLTY
tara:strand:- start:4405 stop:5610 length:1206 start_codon:yes stop_codon:yes gene_type:complete